MSGNTHYHSVAGDTFRQEVHTILAGNMDVTEDDVDGIVRLHQESLFNVSTASNAVGLHEHDIIIEFVYNLVKMHDERH